MCCRCAALLTTWAVRLPPGTEAALEALKGVQHPGWRVVSLHTMVAQVMAGMSCAMLWCRGQSGSGTREGNVRQEMQGTNEIGAQKTPVRG